MGDRNGLLQDVGKGEITEELKPCPFCGGEPVAVETHPGSGFIQCKRCGCAMDEYEAGDPYNLTEHWNRRVERTCRMEPTKDGGEWRCSECGYLQGDAYRGDKGWCLPRYCQVCGAKVVASDADR